MLTQVNQMAEHRVGGRKWKWPWPKVTLEHMLKHTEFGEGLLVGSKKVNTLRLTAKALARYPNANLGKPKFLTRSCTPLELHRGGQPDAENDPNHWRYAENFHDNDDASDSDSGDESFADYDVGSDEEYVYEETEEIEDHFIVPRDMGGNDYINDRGRWFRRHTIHTHVLTALGLIIGFYKYFIRQSTTPTGKEILDPLLIKATLEYMKAIVPMPIGKGYIERICDGFRKIMVKAQQVF